MSIEIVNKTKQAMEEAYQNREHEALQHVAELLQEYQMLLQNLACLLYTSRITNNIILHNTTGNINGNKVNVNNLNNQMTSQKKIQRPSENPVIAVRSLRLRTTLSEIDQYYENNIPDAESWMKVTETALANMKTILTDIRTPVSYTHLIGVFRFVYGIYGGGFRKFLRTNLSLWKLQGTGAFGICCLDLCNLSNFQCRGIAAE